MAKKKYYAVKGEDVENQIFDNWPECEAFVKGRKGVKFKGFATMDDANHFLNPDQAANDDTIYAYVDGSFTPSNPKGGWGLVVVQQDNVLHQAFGETPEPALSRNIDGEILASLQAVNWANTQNKAITICYDYKGIEEWALGRWGAKSEIAKFYITQLQGKLSNISFKKVAAHSGNKWNEEADKLAKMGSGVIST